jgi:phosphomannomutase
VIFPELHYGRDALVGIALILSGLAQRKISLLDWKNELPYYYMQKVKIPISSNTEIKNLFIQIENNFSHEIFETFKDDGLKLVFKDSWIHVRSSNTEPILRIIAESPSYEKTHELIEKVKRML